MQTVTAEYVQGIKEGREFLNAHNPSLFDMLVIVDNLKSTIATFNPGPVKDLLKGERDFWKYQIKKL